VRVPDLEKSRRLEHVANEEGIGISVLLPEMEPHAPGVVFRPLDEDTPPIGYGVAWSPNQTSPSLESFIEVAREVAASETPPSAA
jgi:DNA-binding transcriptional LysR family regulator